MRIDPRTVLCGPRRAAVAQPAISRVHGAAEPGTGEHPYGNALRKAIGTAAAWVDGGWDQSCRDGGLRGEGEFVLDPGELAECALASAAVIGVLDPEHHRVVRHSATMAALIGGGSGQIRPGALCRAQRGVLCLDEATARDATPKSPYVLKGRPSCR